MKLGRQSSVEKRIWGLFPWGYPKKARCWWKNPSIKSINGCKLGVPPLQEAAILPKYYQYKMTSVGQEIEVWETMGSRWVDSTLGMIRRIATSNNHKTLPSMDRNLSWLAAEKIQQVIFLSLYIYIYTVYHIIYHISIIFHVWPTIFKLLLNLQVGHLKIPQLSQ